MVSVIIAVKNGERYLGNAIESALAQTCHDKEIIVVDGRSIDTSRAIAESFAEVRVVTQEGEGFADAWNLGIAAARGDLIAILDSDDWWTPDKLASQLELMKRDPAIEYVICRMKFVLEHGVSPPAGFKPELLEGDHIANMPSALLVRKSLFDRIGCFDTTWDIASDVEWFARAKDYKVPIGVVSRVLLFKRVHDANLSYLQSRTFSKEVVLLLKQSLDRQRGRGTITRPS